jgi:Fur family ferric uptake transcriptional regulator
MTHQHAFDKTLRQRGHRITPQREMIIEIIAQSNRHMTAEEVFAAVQERTQAINIATVYRTLNFLFEEGLISRVDLGDGQIVYTTTRHGPHIHLVCQRCNRVIEADDCSIETLDEQLRTKYGFIADLQHIAIFGVCVECQSKI